MVNKKQSPTIVTEQRLTGTITSKNGVNGANNKATKKMLQFSRPNGDGSNNRKCGYDYFVPLLRLDVT